jgi:predicted DNA-binding transcriptional regulator YafY
VNKLLKTIERLIEIDKLIRNENVKATLPAIAKQLNISERTVSSDFVILRRLEAPVEMIGLHRDGQGFRYSKPFDLRVAIVDEIDKLFDNQCTTENKRAKICKKK